jgi:hypothetical protein
MAEIPYFTHVHQNSIFPHKDFRKLYIPFCDAEALNLAAYNANFTEFYAGCADDRFAYFVLGHQYTYCFAIRVDLDTFQIRDVIDLKTANANWNNFELAACDGRYLYAYQARNDLGNLNIRIDCNNFVASQVSATSSIRNGCEFISRYPIHVPEFFVITTGALIYTFNGSGLNSTSDFATQYGDPSLQGFRGGFSYKNDYFFVPGTDYKILRINQGLNMVATLDLTSLGIRGFRGGFTDGRYGYLVPYRYSADHGNLLRFDPENFTIQNVSILNLASINSSFKGFWGGFSDGRYGYLIPHPSSVLNRPYLVRVDLYDFQTVEAIDLSQIDGGAGCYRFRGGFASGNYGYLIPESNGTVVRFRIHPTSYTSF